MATQIRVKTQDDSLLVFLDISKDQPMTANFQFKDIQDVKSNKGNHTFNFRIPSSANNDNFFSQYFDVNQFGNYNPKARVEATIIKDSIEVFQGYLQLTNVYCSNGATYEYQCVIFSSVSSLGQALTGLQLPDIDFSDLDHNLTTANVMDSWQQNFLNGDVVYSLYDYGAGWFGGNQTDSIALPDSYMSIFEMRPQVRISKAIELILKHVGYSYESEFFQTEMTDLYMDANNGIGLSISSNGYDTAYIVDLSLGAGIPSTVTMPIQDGAYNVLMQSAFNVDTYNQYNSTTGVYSPLNFWQSVQVTAWVQLTCPVSVISDNVFAKFLIVDLSLVENQDLNNFDGWTGVVATTGADQLLVAGNQNIFNISNPEVVCFTNSQFVSVIRLTNVDSSYGGTITINNAQLNYNPNGNQFTGVDDFGNPEEVDFICAVDMSQNMAPVKALDFITSLTRKFNLVIIPDEQVPTHLYIEPFSNWVDQGDSIDWTDKLDTSKDIEYKPTADLQAKELSFSDGVSADFMNSMFAQEVGRIYGTQIVDNSSNDFGKKKEQVKTTFFPTITTYIPNTGIKSCVCYDAEGVNVAGVRISHYNGYHGSDTSGEYFYIWGGGATFSPIQVTQWAVFSNYSDNVITDATTSLSFMGETTGQLNAPQPLNSAYRNYWLRYLEETYSIDSRLLKAKFWLSALDIQTMQFNDVIRVQNEYFRINKITSYPLVGEGSCSVELIKSQRVNVETNLGVECDIEPNVVFWGTVFFINSTTGIAASPNQECCEAYGYTWNSASSYCEATLLKSKSPLQPINNTYKINNIVKGKNNLLGTYSSVIGKNNTIESNSNITGFNNKSFGYGSMINGNVNRVSTDSENTKIVGDFSHSIIPVQKIVTPSLKLDTGQSWKNNSIQGDYGYSIASGETLLSAGADPLYNEQGRSQSGHFVRHAFGTSDEIIFIGQNGQYTRTTGKACMQQDGRNAFKMPYPSLMMFTMIVSGAERGTTSVRSQNYSYREYSGVINNQNNSLRPQIESYKLDKQEESRDFNTLEVNPKFPMPYTEKVGSDDVYINDGMFYFEIDTNGQYFGAQNVDWTIDFKYTFQAIQNVPLPKGELPFYPKTQIPDMRLWLDASNIGSIIHTSGVVSEWQDLSGNNHHMIAYTGGGKPTYNQDISNPKITFNSSSNDCLYNTDVALDSIGDGDNTLFVVFQSANDTAISGGSNIAGATFKGKIVCGVLVNVLDSVTKHSVFNNTTSTTNYDCYLDDIAPTTKQVIMGKRASTSREIHDSNNNFDIATNSANSGAKEYSIGGAKDGSTFYQLFDGDILEVQHYERELTSTEVSQVRNYLESKWSA